MSKADLRQDDADASPPDASVRRLQLARRIDAAIRTELRNKRTAEARCAMLVLEMDETRLYEAFLFTSVSRYCEAVCEWSESKTAKIVAMARKLRTLPKLRAAFLDGRAEWTKVYLASQVATPETDSEWTEKVLTMRVRDLERAVAEEKDEEPTSTLVIPGLTDEQLALFHQATAEVRNEKGTDLTLAAAFVEVVRRALDGGSTGKVGSRPRALVLHSCKDCGTCTREGRDGPVVLSKAEVERETRDPEVIDITKWPPEVSRWIPTEVSRFVEARDRGRCRVPECTNRGKVERHHEGGFRATGHDPECVYLTCDAHHDRRHDGSMRVVRLARGIYQFMLADGTVVGKLDIALSDEMRKQFEVWRDRELRKKFHVEPGAAALSA